MAEDVKDKIRRNLVFFCGAYLAMAYLGIGWGDLVRAQYLTWTNAPIDPARMQHISLAVAGYLAFRWVTSTEFSSGWAEVKKWWEIDLSDFSRSQVKRALLRNPGRAPEWIELDAVSDDAQGEIDRWIALGDLIAKDRKVVYRAYIEQSGQMGLGGGRFSFLLQRNGAGGDFSPWPRGTLGALAKRPNRLKPLIFIQALLRALFREHAWEWLFPNLLATGALLLMAYRAFWS